MNNQSYQNLLRQFVSLEASQRRNLSDRMEATYNMRVESIGKMPPGPEREAAYAQLDASYEAITQRRAPANG